MGAKDGISSNTTDIYYIHMSKKSIPEQYIRIL